MKKIFLTFAGTLCFGIAALHAQQVDSTGAPSPAPQTPTQQQPSEQYRQPRYQNPANPLDSTGIKLDSTMNNGQSMPTGTTGQGYQYDTATHINVQPPPGPTTQPQTDPKKPKKK